MRWRLVKYFFLGIPRKPFLARLNAILQNKAEIDEKDYMKFNLISKAFAIPASIFLAYKLPVPPDVIDPTAGKLFSLIIGYRSMTFLGNMRSWFTVNQVCAKYRHKFKTEAKEEKVPGEKA